MSNTLPHLSIWYLFGYCFCYYCCCSLIHSPTALISIISHQLIQRNVIIVTRRLMQAAEMRNGLWQGVLQAVTYSGEFSPTLPRSTTLQKPWPITELHPSRLCSEAYVSLSADTLYVTEFIYSAEIEEMETQMRIIVGYIWVPHNVEAHFPSVFSQYLIYLNLIILQLKYWPRYKLHDYCNVKVENQETPKQTKQKSSSAVIWRLGALMFPSQLWIRKSMKDLFELFSHW